MADAAIPPQTPAARRPARPLLLGLGLALALGGGGFYAGYSGLLPSEWKAGDHAPAAGEPLPEVAFVPLPPLIISLPPGSSARHLRFAGEIEVPLGREEEVARILPRVLDVLNGYLRAVDARQFDEPAALIRLRAQMLRRVQLVAGEGRVRDLLVTEFVLN